MDIKMIGIDHTIAGVDDRQIFSFTTTQKIDAMIKFLKNETVNGCVLLSTCNRMELYVSCKPNSPIDLYDTLCEIKDVNPENYRGMFTFREGIDAARHLISLTAGMESRIIGEDQILSQVKDALSFAREHDGADKVLEVLFRMAITAGKKVRSEVQFSHGNHSAISRAIYELKQKGHDFNGKVCMVIGNGEMGKLTATALQEAGADVTVTVRQYRSGVVQIPVGCKRINYGERYDFMPKCSYIVSATSSPNVTLTAEEVSKAIAGCNDKKVFIDIAVPRDIEPCVGDIPGAELYDIDSFEVDKQSEEMRESVAQSNEIVETALEEFTTWYSCRNFVPLIKNISEQASKDISWRMGKTLNSVDLDESVRDKIDASIESTAAKVVSKLIFQLRDSVDSDTLRECLDAFVCAYPESAEGLE